MYYRLCLATLALAACAWSLPHGSPCKEVQIPISVTASRLIITTTIENDWDVVSLAFNLTERDIGSATDPLPIAGTTSSPVPSEFTVGATLCGNGSTVLVLTHGIIESKKYWRPAFEGAEEYNFVDAALAAGYSVLSYDRIGVGSSSKVDAIQDAQFQVETAVLDELVAYTRETMNAAHVALVGHSYGAYLSAASANHTNVDAVVLTGFSGSFDKFAPFVAGAALKIANTLNTTRWGHLDRGYLTTSDVYATTYVYFKEPYFEHRVAEWTHEVAIEPFAVGELPSLIAAPYDNFNNVSAPVLILQGQFDVSACGGNCVGFLEESRLRGKVFQSAKAIETVEDLPAGHNLNFHKIAPQAFQMVFNFLKTHAL